MLANLRDLWRHRALIGVLTARELKARYRGSVLGFLWSLLNPLLMLGVYTIVFQLIFPNRSESTRPYALFLFCGLLPWNWLASALTDAASSLLVSGSLLKKILFPAEVLPLVSVAAQGVHFLLALPVLAAGLVLGALGVLGGHVPVGLAVVQAVPLFLLEGLFVTGLGLFLAALTVHFRDVKDLIATGLSLWFFSTPVLYALPDIRSERLKTILSWNPATPFFEAWHDAFFRAAWIPPGRWGVLAVLSFVSFFVGFAFFDRLRDSFPEAV